MARIVMVEDDVWMADCYRKWLQTAGHDVRHATDAQSALDMLDDQAPDVILLDLLLPHASGVQFLHTLQSHADLARIPVVLCSSSLPNSLPPLAPYGIYKVLDKAALSPEILRQALEGALSRATV